MMVKLKKTKKTKHFKNKYGSCDHAVIKRSAEKIKRKFKKLSPPLEVFFCFKFV